MLLKFFDVETTGIKKAEVVQIGAIVVDSDNMEVVSMKSEYVSPSKDIEPEATEVNGLTREIVDNLSGGKRIEDLVFKDSFWWTFFFGKDPTCFVTYNGLFDFGALNYSLINCGVGFNITSDFNPNFSSLLEIEERTELCIPGMPSHLDLYKKVRRDYSVYNRNKLSMVCERMLDLNKVNEEYISLKKKFGVVTFLNEFHDATYDSFLCYKLYRRIYGL